MTLGTHPVMDPVERVRERCSALGLMSWEMDPGTLTLRGPADASAGLVGRWLATDTMRERVRDGLSRQTPREEPTTVDLSPGLRLVTVSSRRGRRVLWTVAVLSIDPGAHVAPGLTDGIDADALAAEIHARAAACQVAPAHVEQLLTWMRDDLVDVARNVSAINEFSVQLAEMYEEIGLLYRVGKSMNRIAEPEAFVRLTCEELVQTLAFGWIGVRFMETDRVTGRLSGRVLTAGEPPCEMRELARLTRDAIGGLPSAAWTLLRPDDCPLAARAGSQVLAHPLLREGEMVGALLAGGKTGDDPEITSAETQLLDAAAGYLGVFLENAGLYADQRLLFVGTVEALTASIDAKDRYTCGHSERVAYLGATLAAMAGRPEAECERVRIAGLLHDVGKIGVPESVLSKPGRLTEEEFEQIKLHPSIGYRILRDIPGLDDVLPGVLYHHERWDGAGYPEGRRGADLPLIARLLAVADAFDAMSSTRSYRSALPRDRVLEEVLAGAGTQFDPQLAALFVQLDFAEYDQMVRRHQSRKLSAA